jgi:hypothetical protein
MNEQKTLLFLSNKQKSVIYTIFASYIETGLDIRDAINSFIEAYKEEKNIKYISPIMKQLASNLKSSNSIREGYPKTYSAFENAFDNLSAEEKIYLYKIDDIKIEKDKAIFFREMSKILAENNQI